MTKLQKEAFARKAQELVNKIKENIQPIPEPQEMNHCVDVISKWKGQYFYINQKYKVAPHPGQYKDFFEAGIVRLKPVGTDSFQIAYFRHTGKWETLDMMYDYLSYEEVEKAVLNDAWFQVF